LWSIQSNFLQNVWFIENLIGEKHTQIEILSVLCKFSVKIVYEKFLHEKSKMDEKWIKITILKKFIKIVKWKHIKTSIWLHFNNNMWFITCKNKNLSNLREKIFIDLTKKIDFFGWITKILFKVKKRRSRLLNYDFMLISLLWVNRLRQDIWYFSVQFVFRHIYSIIIKIQDY
jgi:hypothetical protein